MGFTKFVITGIFAGIVIAVCLFFFEIAKRLLDAIDALGQLVFIVPILVVLFCSCALVIVGTWTLIQRLLLWARSIRPDKHTALYPQVRVDPRKQDRQAWLDLNAQGAQVVAALPRGVKVGARELAQVMTPAAQAQAPAILPAAPAWAQLPPASFQAQHVYDAPIPKEIAVPVGVDESGRQISVPVEGTAALIAGGLPNHGKSELAASMLAGLMRGDPTGTRVQIAIIDPKRVDFARIPPDMAGLWRPVARDVETGVMLVNDLWAECQRRFELLESHGAVSLPDLLTQGERLPYVVCLVDEWASFAGVEAFNGAALNVARMGRAAGIMLILATQRPSRSVVNPDIKACAAATVAFRCRSRADSIVLMDDPAAADLPSVPGRAIVAMGEHTHVHTYQAGIKGGRFGTFMASLPRAGAAMSYQPVASYTAQPGGGSPLVGPVGPVGPAQRLERGRAPSEDVVNEMRRLYAIGQPWSLTALCNRYWGYKDDVVLTYVRDAVGYVKGSGL